MNWCKLALGLLAMGQLAACSMTQYMPQVVARGEITLAYRDGFEMSAGGKRIARSLGWRGLPEYVRCVPPAHDHAKKAKRDGALAVAFSVLGGTLGVAGSAGLVGAFADPNPSHFMPWLVGGVAAAVVGTVLAGLGRMERNSANGHAVDAMNYYNDVVGSLGATCDDLTYPPPILVIPPPPNG